MDKVQPYTTLASSVEGAPTNYDAGPARAFLHGIWRVIPSPACTEILAQSGLDFQILDCEHGAYDYQTLLPDILACEANHCAPWIRVSGTDKIEVQRCLDLGAHGIVFPQLSTSNDIAAAARMMDHAPVGVRGFNPFVRAYGYGAPKTPARPWFVPIIETLDAVDQIETIVKLDRIDLVYIGSYDLSAQLGVPGKMDAPELTRIVGRIIDACRRAQKRVGAMTLNDAATQALGARGVTALVHGVESHRFKQAMTSAVQSARAVLSPPTPEPPL